MKITIRKIAEMAGCSRSAVDKVIHGRPGVREEVRREVLRIIEETGYVPLHLKPDAHAPASEEKRVAVLLPRLNNQYFKMLKAGMDQLCAAMPGLTLEYYHCDADDISGMLAVLDRLQQQPIDLYIIRGVQSRRLKTRLDQVGVPVIFFDSAVPGAEHICFLGENCYQSGRIAASLLTKVIPCGGEIAVIGGSPKISGHKLRLQGFLEALQMYRPDIQIAEQLYSQDQHIIAYERTCKILEQYPKLRGICNLAGHSGEVGQAILDMNRQDAVKMVCYNHTDDIAALIRRGIIEFSINLAPEQQGRILLETAYHYLLHGQIPPAVIYTPVSILMNENIEFIAEGSDTKKARKKARV